MNSHAEIQDLLEGYVDETLDRDTYRVVDAHLAGCEECRTILDEVAPVDLTELAGGAIDDRVLRRSVRRAVRRTVIDTALGLLALWIALWLIAALVVQPLIVGRGDRAVAASRATYDLAMMFNEGATVTDIEISSGFLQREFTMTVALPIGSNLAEMGSISTRLGILGFGDANGGRVWPFVESLDNGGDAQVRLEQLGSGTVATVATRFSEPISIGRAQQIADSTAHDVRVVWAGFPIDDAAERSGMLFEPGSTVGYGTCLSPVPFDDGFFGATSAGGGGSGSIAFSNASIETALSEVRRALANLADHSGLTANMGVSGSTSPERIGQALDYLTQPDPGVTSLVVTGPTPEIVGFLDDVGADWVSVLGVDLYNWSQPVCGRWSP